MWLATGIGTLIGDGRVPVGVRLPAERELGVALGLSRTTVTAAYRRLRSDGWSASRLGAGSWTRLPTGIQSGTWLPAPFDDRVIDFAHAAPEAPPELAAAYAAAVNELPAFLPQHGYFPAGLPVLRFDIAQKYTERGVPTRPDQILVTSGAIHALSIALSTLLRPGDHVLVEHPSYPNALDTARSLRARLLPVALDSGAVDEWIAQVSRVLLEVRPAYAYLMPDVQNPTGAYLDASQRQQLGRALGRVGCVPIVDETLADLVFDGQAAPPFASFASNCISIGSLSKTVWGGMRVGWVRASADVIQRLVAHTVQATPSQPIIEQLAACHLLGQTRPALTALCGQLMRNCDVMTDALHEHLPQWEVTRPSGGVVLWCKLPGAYSTALTATARHHGLRLAPGPRFGVGHAFEDRLRLPFGYPPDLLRRGVALLARADQDVAAHGARCEGRRQAPWMLGSVDGSCEPETRMRYGDDEVSALSAGAVG
ncbi:MAG: PLP-dependent aminotransferase family protein [Streptosporangiaceae bacterium]